MRAVPTVVLHLAVVIPRPRLRNPDRTLAADSIRRDAAPYRDCMGAGAVARFEKAEIVRFESGTDAPESSVDLPQPAVPIEIDSSRPSSQRGARWIERDVRRVWTLEVSLRCALKGINRFGSSADAATGDSSR